MLVEDHMHFLVALTLNCEQYVCEKNIFTVLHNITACLASAELVLLIISLH